MTGGQVGVAMPPEKKARGAGINVGGVTMPPSSNDNDNNNTTNNNNNNNNNVGGVTMPPPDRNVGGVTMPPTGSNVGGVTMPPANRNVGGVTMPPSSAVSAAPVGVAMPPKWHQFAKLQAKGKAAVVAREEERPVHPDDAVILAKIDDPVEKMKVAKKLRKRRKKMYRDRDFGGPAMGRGRTTKLLSQGRHTTRTDLSANNTLTQIEAAKNRKLPGATMPKEVQQQLELDRLREETAQTMLEMQNAGIVNEGDQLSELEKLQPGDIDPVTGKVLDINDIEYMKIRAKQELLKPLLKKEERHKQTGGRSYARFADKRDDPDRLTWDEFMQLHKGDMDFGQKQEMGEYRKRLDEERERKLKASRDAKKLTKKELKAKRKKLLAKRKRKASGLDNGGESDDSADGDFGVAPLSSFLQGSDDDGDSD